MEREKVKLIYCINLKRYLGMKGNLLYDFKQDKLIFSNATRYSTVIMGYNTYKELGKPLSNRNNIVIINQKYPMPFFPDNVIIAYSLEQAIEKAKLIESEIFIIGGSKIYNEAIANDRKYNYEIVEVHETLVYDNFEGDVLLNKISNLDNFKIKTNKSFSDLNRLDDIYYSLVYKVYKKY